MSRSFARHSTPTPTDMETLLREHRSGGAIAGQAGRDRAESMTGVARLCWAFLGALVSVAAGWALWYALAWMQFRRASAPADSAAPLDRLIPVFEVAERHEVVVRAPPSVTFAAALALDLERAPVIHAIFAGRRVLLASGDTATAHLTLAELEAMGWARVAETPHEVVFGAITQPWQSNVTFRALPAAEFASFAHPGWVKIAWTLAVDSLAPDRSRFRTETRVVTTDAAARRRFRRYWAAFSPGIVLIRWQAVRLIRAQAEREVARP